MSEITRFNEEVKKSPEMLEALKEIGNDLEKVVAFANSKGYKISMEDLKVQMQQEGELTEENLDNVSGGITAIATGIIEAKAVFIL